MSLAVSVSPRAHRSSASRCWTGSGGRRGTARCRARRGRRPTPPAPPFGRGRRVADDVHVDQHAVAVLVARDDRRRDAGLRAPIGQPLADVLAQFLARAAHVDAQSVQPRRRPGRRLGRIQVDGDRKLLPNPNSLVTWIVLPINSAGARRSTDRCPRLAPGAIRYRSGRTARTGGPGFRR